MQKKNVVCLCQGDENGKSFSLRGNGFDCVPELGYNHYRRVEICKSYHAHQGCVELVFCLRGNCVYATPEGDYAFRSGAVFMSGPGRPHLLKTYHKNLRLYWIRFRVGRTGSSFLGLPPSEGQWIADRLVNMPNRVFRGTEALRAAFSRVFVLCESQTVRSEETRMRLRIALLDLAVATVDAGDSRPCAPLNKSLEAVVARMRRTPEGVYPVDALADELGVSVSGLMQAFKRQTGFSPHAFLLSCRIDRAKRLLADGISVSSVANQLGFSTQKRFSSYFRQTVGCTPSAWRHSEGSS